MHIYTYIHVSTKENKKNQMSENDKKKTRGNKKCPKERKIAIPTERNEKSL